MTQTADTLTLPEKFERLENILAHEIQERTREVHTAILAILSMKHHFQLGPPGTAKSLLVSRIARRISGLGDEGYFHWLLTKYTTPEEIFGPPSLPLLKEGKYYRVTDRKLPRAAFVFLDEIFKANSSILNANLTAMNERVFFNGDDDPNIPLITLFAASNEMPESDELAALWDRVHFRHLIKPMQESGNFMRMLTTVMPDKPEQVLSLQEIREATQIVRNVEVPNDVYDGLKTLRDALREEGVEPTDRRWMDCIPIIQAEAFFNGRSVAEIDDMRPLMYVLWTDEREIKTVTKEVLELANPIDREANDLLERITDLESEFKQVVRDADNPKAIAKQAVEIHGKMQRAKARMDDLKERAAESGRKSPLLEELHDKFVSVAKLLMRDGFGVESGDVL